MAGRRKAQRYILPCGCDFECEYVAWLHDACCGAAWCLLVYEGNVRVVKNSAGGSMGEYRESQQILDLDLKLENGGVRDPHLHVFGLSNCIMS